MFVHVCDIICVNVCKVWGRGVDKPIWLNGWVLESASQGHNLKVKNRKNIHTLCLPCNAPQSKSVVKIECEHTSTWEHIYIATEQLVFLDCVGTCRLYLAN